MGKIPVRLTEVYACCCYLTTGCAAWVKQSSHLPTKFRRTVVEKMELELKRDNTGKRYYGDEEKVWNFYVTNFGDSIKRNKIRDLQHLEAIVSANNYNIWR